MKYELCIYIDFEMRGKVQSRCELHFKAYLFLCISKLEVEREGIRQKFNNLMVVKFKN